MPLLHGYVALVDVLGFKGIWQRADPDEVFANMKSLAELMESRVKFTQGVFDHLLNYPSKVKVALISDTVAIGLGRETDLALLNDEDRRYMLLQITHLLIGVVHHWLHGDPPMAIRGCITAGTFGIEGPFIMGSAVDEAASLYEQAEGALIWLAPSALGASGLRLELEREDHSDIVFQNWDVPLKVGNFRTFVLDPIGGSKGPKEADVIRQRTLGSMKSPNIAVAIKRQNTEDFFDRCLLNAGRMSGRFKQAEGLPASIDGE